MGGRFQPEQVAGFTGMGGRFGAEYTLPIFYIHPAILYTPGRQTSLSPSEAAELDEIYHHAGPSDNDRIRNIAIQFENRAKRTIRSWQQRIEKPFEPECLILYLSNHCNMECSYCYAAETVRDQSHRNKSTSVIDEKSVRAAARLVAGHCAENHLPLRVVFHGGGEPTIHWSLLKRLEIMTRDIANEYQIAWWGYLATNGMLSPIQLKWVAEHFDLIGISCDGPPGIQDAQRSLFDGRPSSHTIESTVKTLKEHGAQFIIRSTITPESVERQKEIVTYCHEQLGASSMRFEPQYHITDQISDKWLSFHADGFVDHFLEAQEEAKRRNCLLSYSGVRMEEVHAGYCDVLRNGLHLTPDGNAAACFFSLGHQNSKDRSLSTGYYDNEKDIFVLNQDRIREHKRTAGRIPERCRSCLNAYHCARECPEVCLSKAGTYDEDWEPGFRCTVNQRLAENWILKRAGLHLSLSKSFT